MGVLNPIIKNFVYNLVLGATAKGYLFNNSELLFFQTLQHF